METIFYYSYRKAAFQSIMWACSIGIGGGVLIHFLNKLMTLPNIFMIIAYFLYAVSFFLVFISILFVLRPNKKYVVLTESKIEIISEKNHIEIPRSQISSIQLCDSPIEYRWFTGLRPFYFPEVCIVLKLSLAETSDDIIDNKTKMEKHLIPSQLAYISDDKKQIYIRKAPVGGFEPLLRALNEKV